ncbi:hypothetical protein V6N11_054896 [Hibiscus sabdariffa]|uniref:Uncharacterized protein n=1 Tax=Hibiscus sabdariffa TaxID=183260 RepID=A0ABR2P3E2_9ROSI
MEISTHFNRKRVFEHLNDGLDAKMREVIKIIEDRVVELNPGNWGTQGFGPVEDIDMLKIAHFPCSITGASPIINKIEWFYRESSLSLMSLLWNTYHENEKAHGVIGMLVPSLVITAITDGVCNVQCMSYRFIGAIVSASTGTVVLEEGRNGDIQG